MIRSRLPAALLVALAVAVHAPTLGHRFLLDDGVQIFKNRAVTDGAPRWRGIVEEGLRDVEDLTDPMRYFSAGDSPDALEHNVKRVMDDVSSFLDLGSVESYPTAEYILRTLPA